MDVAIAGFTLIPILVGFGQVLKIAGIPSRFLPLVLLVIAVILAFIAEGFGVIQLLTGATAGLSASGLYDLGKKTIAGK